jgi:2-desacetyl-2-hydroxyethyl bacteriochlorophyllide A dehydrogenase
MKAIVFDAPGELRVEEVPSPVPGERQVLVRIAAAGVCGSDLHLFKGKNPWGPPPKGPRRGGHEFAGVVAAIGPGVSRVKVGQRVGVEPAHLMGCRRCAVCARGDAHLCSSNPSRRFSCGFSEYDVADEESVFVLPDSVSFEEAALIDVYACAVHAARRVPVSGRTAVVLGTGAVAMTLGQVLRASGARKVILVGRREEPLRLALEVGAADVTLNLTRTPDLGAAVRELTEGLGAECVFEAVGGDGSSVKLALDAAAPGGVIGLAGSFWADVALPYAAANDKEIDLRFCNSYGSREGVREYQLALELVASGRVRAAPLVTHRFPLSRAQEAFFAAEHKLRSGAVKVIIQPDA